MSDFPPTLDPLDKRLNAWRDDIADVRLRGKVQSEKFIEGELHSINVAVANLKTSPSDKAQTEHQLLMGASVTVFESESGWSWVQALADGYVGYLHSDALVAANSIDPTTTPMRVKVPATFTYSSADLREPPVQRLSMGSVVYVGEEVQTRGTNYLLNANGHATIANHLAPLDVYADDPVSVCEQLLNTPYLWGGDSADGIDCSGLVQLSLSMCGVSVLRDSDMQAASIGTVIEAGKNFENLQRGDLIFWRGHVAFHQGEIDGVPHIIHANGHTMSVASEPLNSAIERIAYLYEKPIGFRRPRMDRDQ